MFTKIRICKFSETYHVELDKKHGKMTVLNTQCQDDFEHSNNELIFQSCPMTSLRHV